MASSRGLSLLHQAHVEGKIDLRDADTFDCKWWLKVLWTLDWVSVDNHNRVDSLRHNLHCNLIQYLAGKEVVDLHWDQADKISKRIKHRLFPWVEDGPSQATIEKMAADWKAVWGDPKDPKVALEIDRTVAHLLRMPKRKSRRGK